MSYAIADKWEIKLKTPIRQAQDKQNSKLKTKDVLDRWIVSRLHQTVEVATTAMEKYEAHIAARQIEKFVSDLSLWYVRRSRDRVGPSAVDEKSKQAFYETMYEVLVTLSKLLVPFVPFISENIYKNLTGNESAQVADWPETIREVYDTKLEEEMRHAMELSSIIHGFRKTANVKVRIPFKKLSYKGPMELSEEVMRIVLDEVNVYELSYKGNGDNYEVSGDTSEKNQDLNAGFAREIVRQIQEERKKLGTELNDRVDVMLENWPEEFEQKIKRQGLVRQLTKGKEFIVRRIT